MSKEQLPDWEEILSAAARLQGIIPEAVLVGGSAAALHAKHRRSEDADHVVANLSQRFDEVLGLLESVAGWKTARIKKPVLILGNLDGIDTGIRQLIRKVPLETIQIDSTAGKVTIPTSEEILRIKAALILNRNATRDYVDFVAMAEHLGMQKALAALATLDNLYPQPNLQSALQQLSVQLANPLPYDLEGQDLSEYKNLEKRWHDWNVIKKFCNDVMIKIVDVF
jgi:hypothetical protein